MTEKRFMTQYGVKIHDLHRGNEYLVNEVDAHEIVELLNRLDMTVKEKRKGMSTLQKKINDLHEENEQLKQELHKIKVVNEMLSMDFANSEHELWRENEQLKKELYDCKKDEKQLSISFMEFKMQLIEVLQQNYTYAYNQRQKNLDKSIVARTYEVLYQTIDNIAETMNVDIERFPKGDVE